MYRNDTGYPDTMIKFVSPGTSAASHSFDPIRTSDLALSRRCRRRIFPLGLFGISSMNTTPPVNHFGFDLTRDTC